MGGLSDIYHQPVPERLVAGRCANSPTTVNDPLLVIIPSLDEKSVWGPVPYIGHGEVPPEEGDDCLVGIDETGSPWVLVWGTTAGGSGVDSGASVSNALDLIAALQSQVGTLSAAEAALQAEADANAAGLLVANASILQLQAQVASLLVPLVGVLPASPNDGDRVNYLADATNGVIWPLVYRAADPSTTKWNVLGQPAPLYSEVTTAETTTSTTYAALTTAGPQVTLPLLGDYDVRFEAYMGNTTNGGASDGASMGLSYGGAGVGVFDTATVNNGTAATGDPFVSVAASRRKAALAAASTIVARYQVAAGGAGTAQFRSRRLWVTPVRVG